MEKTNGMPSCNKQGHHSQRIQYLCLDDNCSTSRLLCRSCINESHRKHKVGVIDKVIEPLNRLNMNSCYRSSEEDYDYLKARILSIGQQWEKLTQVFNAHMRKLNEGILFQLTTIMKTFTDGEIDHAYEVLTNTESEIQQVNSYVRMINFLGKKNLQDVDTIKNYSDVMAEKVKRIIGKTVKKIELLLDKMQQHICELDFTKLDQYRLGQKEENESRLKLETFDERTDNDNTNEDSNSGKKTKDQKQSKQKDTKKSNSQSKNKDKNEAEEVPKIGFQKYK